MNYSRLNSGEFASIGIRFRTEKETRAFAKIIKEELDSRVGNELSGCLTRQQLLEFDNCSSQAESKKWLAKNCPDYQSIVKKKKEELEQEIITYRERIPGVISVSEGEVERLNKGTQ